MSIETDVFSELIAKVRRGDSEAMQQILHEYGEAIQREVRFTLMDARLRRFVGNSDVFQSVILRFCSGMQRGSFQIHEPADLLRLMKGIARNRIAELVRFWHAKRRDLSRSINIDDVGSQSPKGCDSPNERLETLEIANAIRDHLSERDSQILTMRDEGWNWSAIAKHFNEPSGEAIRKQHARSLNRIAAALGHDS